MKELLIRLSELKSDKKNLNNEMKDILMQSGEYAELYEEKKQVSEVLKLHKKKAIDESTALSSLEQKIKNKNNEIKLIKDSINDSIVITSKDTNEVIQLSLF